MDASVIIVSYRSAEVITQAVDSVIAQRGVSLELIVVDNASPDESVAVLAAYGAGISLIESPENLGFGPAVNLARTRARGRHLFVLNPDACLDSATGLAELVRAMDADPRLGISSPRLLHPDGSVQSPPRGTYPGARHAGVDHASLPGEIAWLVGAALMIRTSTFDEVGGFDPDFFLFAEETDLCLRVRRAGYALAEVSSVTVTHVGGASMAKLPSFEVWMRRQSALHLFYSKHYPAARVAKLLRRERLRARFRLLVLAVRGLLLGLRAQDRAKLDKYRAMRQAAEQSLAALARGDLGVTPQVAPGAPPR